MINTKVIIYPARLNLNMINTLKIIALGNADVLIMGGEGPDDEGSIPQPRTPDVRR